MFFKKMGHEPPPHFAVISINASTDPEPLRKNPAYQRFLAALGGDVSGR